MARKQIACAEVKGRDFLLVLLFIRALVLSAIALFGLLGGLPLTFVLAGGFAVLHWLALSKVSACNQDGPWLAKVLSYVEIGYAAFDIFQYYVGVEQADFGMDVWRIIIAGLIIHFSKEMQRQLPRKKAISSARG